MSKYSQVNSPDILEEPADFWEYAQWPHKIAKMADMAADLTSTKIVLLQVSLLSVKYLLTDK